MGVSVGASVGVRAQVGFDKLEPVDGVRGEVKTTRLCELHEKDVTPHCLIRWHMRICAYLFGC